MENDQQSSKPQTAWSAVVVEKVQNLVMVDHCSTIRELVEEVGVSKDSAHAILHDDLGMHRVAAKLVPRLLLLEQKDVQVAQDLLDTANTHPEFLNTMITEMSYGWTSMTQKQKDIAKEASEVHKAKKSATGAKQNQGDANCLL